MDGQIKLYFPAPILIQYIDDVVDLEDLQEAVREHKISTLLSVLRRNPLEDIHTTVVMPINLKEYFRKLRRALYGSVLGKDVVLFFKREAPIEIETEDEYEIVFDLDPKVAKKLKIRKYSVIERFLVTDLVFRLYYGIYEDINGLLKAYRRLTKSFIGLTFRQSAKVELTISEYTPFDRNTHPSIMNIIYPVQLEGFMTSCFPLLSKSGIFQMALMYSVYTDRYEEFGLELPSTFVEDCVVHFEKALESYKFKLERFVIDIESILQEGDPIEEFIIRHISSTMNASINTLIVASEEMGYKVSEVYAKLKDLIRRGRVKVEGEHLKVVK